MGKGEERINRGKAASTSSTGWLFVDFLCYKLQLYLHQTSSQSVNQLWSMFKAAKKQHHTTAKFLEGGQGGERSGGPSPVCLGQSSTLGFAI
jgi:hypothetical protein